MLQPPTIPHNTNTNRGGNCVRRQQQIIKTANFLPPVSTTEFSGESKSGALWKMYRRPKKPNNSNKTSRPNLKGGWGVGRWGKGPQIENLIFSPKVVEKTRARARKKNQQLPTTIYINFPSLRSLLFYVVELSFLLLLLLLFYAKHTSFIKLSTPPPSVVAASSHLYPRLPYLSIHSLD